MSTIHSLDHRTDRMDSFERHTGLRISADHRAGLLALLEARNRKIAERRRHRRVVQGNGDRSRAQDAVSEAAKLQAASDTFLRLLTNSNVSGLNWADALRASTFFSDIKHPLIGASLSIDEWRSEMIRLFTCFSDMAASRADYYAEDPGLEAEIPGEELANFANCLAFHFIRIGGVLGGRTGKSGFPTFLKLVWNLLPQQE